MMQPNDLPLVCLPLELPPEAAAELIDFLYQLTEALERHYGATIQRHRDDLAAARRTTTTSNGDPPF